LSVKVEKYEGASIKRGKLHFGGANVISLAGEFGTPLYVIDEGVFRDRCRSYREAFESRYSPVKVLLASKALITLATTRIAREEGLGMDVASIGEMRGALKAGVPAGEMFFHGNFKKEEELEEALRRGIGRIVVDSHTEADTLDSVARRLNVKARVLLRITPGVEAHTHEMIQVGKLDTKFGVPLEGGAAEKLIIKIVKKRGLDFMGIHYHIGSQILDVEPFRVSIRKAVDFLSHINNRLGIRVRELDVGGGYPVRYSSKQPLPKPDRFAAAICSTLKKEVKEAGIEPPALYLEPGRSIAGPAGITLYTVGPVKEIRGVRRYVSVDGGMSDNPRPALYDAEYDAVIASRPDSKQDKKKYRVCGRHCETDTLIPEISLPGPRPGDILAVFSTGAYNYTMSGNYNMFPRPAMVLVKDGKAELIVEREKVDKLFAGNVVPKRLKK